jgi:NADH-quinone oxidoreductase subunit N
MAILAIGTAGADRSMMYYLLTYSVATIGAFGAFIVVSEQKGDESFTAFNGLSKKSPFFAAILAISMLSLAGIPPLAGFFGKYFLFTAAFAKYPWLVIVAVINSAISIYYYFKIIIAAYFTKESAGTTSDQPIVVPAGIRWTLVLCLILIVLMTIMPGSVYSII